MSFASSVRIPYVRQSSQHAYSDGSKSIMAATAINAYMGSASGEIKEVRRASRPLAGSEVLIAVSHSGVCGTDEHYKKQDMVLGHEGVGRVVDIGPDVKHVCL